MLQSILAKVSIYVYKFYSLVGLTTYNYSLGLIAHILCTKTDFQVHITTLLCIGFTHDDHIKNHVQ